MPYRAVIFDLGGVVLDSPLHVIARYEEELALPAGSIGGVVTGTGSGGAWSRLERGELGMDAFYAAFDRECADAGHEISAHELMERIAASAQPRASMLRAVGRIRDEGLRVSALTNNWVGEEPQMHPLREHFDVFVESSVVGLRKPDPRIYRHACELLEVEPAESVFLDDIGGNLKPARAMGMATIKVEDPDTALGELERLLGFTL